MCNLQDASFSQNTVWDSLWSATPAMNFCAGLTCLAKPTLKGYVSEGVCCVMIVIPLGCVGKKSLH